MPARKRVFEEVEASSAPMPAISPLLKKLRGMWEFACLMQYIYLFGECIKISAEVDIEVIYPPHPPQYHILQANQLLTPLLDARDGVLQTHSLRPPTSDRSRPTQTCLITPWLDVRHHPCHSSRPPRLTLEQSRDI